MTTDNWTWSASRLKAFDRCEVTAYRRYITRDLPDTPSEAMQAGTLFHRIVQGDGDGDPAGDLDLLWTKKGEWTAKAKTAVAEAEELLAHTETRDLLAGCESVEQHVTAELDGRHWQAYLDLVAPGYVVELKSCANVCGTGWMRIDGRNVRAPFWRAMRYDWQAALYSKMTGLPVYVCAADGYENCHVYRMTNQRARLLYANEILPAIETAEQVVFDGREPRMCEDGCAVCGEWASHEITDM